MWVLVMAHNIWLLYVPTTRKYCDDTKYFMDERLRTQELYWEFFFLSLSTFLVNLSMDGFASV